MRLQLVTCISILVAATAAHAQSITSSASCELPHASGVSMQQLMSGQRQRSYRLFVPPGYDSRARLPLVLDLHGSGGSAAKRGARSAKAKTATLPASDASPEPNATGDKAGADITTGSLKADNPTNLDVVVEPATVATR